MSEVDLLVPIKSLALAKSRLRGAADDGVGDPVAHARLAVALTRDTLAAARAASGVGDLVALTSDPDVTSALVGDGIAVLADRPGQGLNAALAYGAETLRTRRPDRAVGALQGDLPALRPDELAEALTSAVEAFRAGIALRAFCADAQGEGTTLLVSAPRVALDPRFGVGSADAHQRAGALRMSGDWPGLRQDVDTPDDLWRAAELGLGPATRHTLTRAARPRS